MSSSSTCHASWRSTEGRVTGEGRVTTRVKTGLSNSCRAESTLRLSSTMSMDPSFFIVLLR